MRAAVIILCASAAAGLRLGLPAATPLARCAAPTCAIRVGEPPAENDRTVVDGPNGPIMVAKVKGEYYAVDATCPHLNLPMKRGKIEDGPDGVTLTCNFHNSCFSMKDGSCKKWVSGVLGVKNSFAAGLMGKVGGKQSDLKAYTVTVQEDGSLSLE